MLLTPAQIKPKSFELKRNSFFTQGGCASCLCACLGSLILLWLLPQSYQYPNLSEGTDHVGGQLRGDKEYPRPFSGVTKSGRVWRKVPESDARSVGNQPTCPGPGVSSSADCAPEAGRPRHPGLATPPAAAALSG